MGLPGPAVALTLLGISQIAFAFVRLDTTPQPPEHPTKATLQNVTLQHLSSGYLKHLYSDLTLLKISNSRIDRIDKYAFDYLSHLNLLEISDSEIGSEINPNTFSRLPGLEILILSNVGLPGVDLNLTHVQQLILARNRIEEIDGDSANGKEITYLDVSGNRIRALKGSFANMSKLSMIDVSKNRIGEIRDVFGENVNLLRILASENEITSTEGLRLPWLKNLDLFANRIQTLDSASFSRMAALEELVLAFNNIAHVDDAFRDLLELRYLNLAWNRIDKLQPNLFRNNLYLTELSLQGNKIKSLDKFPNVLAHLTHLDLSHNLLAQIHDEFFTSTPSLKVLDLSFNRLKTLTDTLAPLAQLQVLNLAYNELSMSGYELSANRELARVNLSSNSLEGGLSHFKKNEMLKDLDVSGNSIVDFCDDAVVLKNLARVNLGGNHIERLECLKEFKALCEVDLRRNPLVCGEGLDDLMLSLAERRRSPYRVGSESQGEFSEECENLSLNRSLALWNSVKREICPEGRDLQLTAENSEWETSEEDSSEEDASEDAEETIPETKPASNETNGNNTQRKQFIVLPIGWIGKDEMNKPNPLESPQSERSSWEKIEENAELLKDLDEEEVGRKSRFSWYTIALILIGLSFSLTCFNLAVFLYIRMRMWRRSDASSPQKYTILHNEVYKNTTEPSTVLPQGDGEWLPENHTKNKIFTFGKINEFLLNFGLPKKEKDTESTINILVSPPNNGGSNC